MKDFLRGSLVVCKLEPEHNDCLPPRKCLLTFQASKDTGIKRKPLVAEAEGVQENYHK